MPINPDHDLMRIFHFNAADIETNRAGRLSDSQVERLSKRNKSAQRLASIGCAGLLIVAVLVIALDISDSTQENLLIAFGILLIGGLPIVYIYLGVMDRQTDLRKDKIKSNVSELRVFESKGDGGQITYVLWAWPIHLNISESVYLDIRGYLTLHPQNTQFRLYYAPESNELLSIEVVDQ
ncbi:MAG: hypothetical protein H0X30_39140 [Anaerolineae bacterium]|nr:hypothetical protein [Anaerolineae bacterium]